MATPGTGAAKGRKRRNMKKWWKHAYQTDNDIPRVVCTTQCENVQTSKAKIKFLAKKQRFLTDCRNFGKTRKQPLARQKTTAVPNGLMCGGKKRHAAKEFRKSTLANESCAIFKKWCENTPFNVSEKFFHKNFKRRKWEIKKKSRLRKIGEKIAKDALEMQENV